MNENTTTPAFKKWFGDSKVVDVNGKPLVVYHGSKSKFKSFDLAKFGKTDAGWYGKGFYFTTDERVANLYGKEVIKAYLSLQKPMSSTMNGFSEGVLKNIVSYAEKVNPGLKISQQALTNALDQRLALDQLESLYRSAGHQAEILAALTNITGFDGVVDQSGTIYVAFHSEQIKF